MPKVITTVDGPHGQTEVHFALTPPEINNLLRDLSPHPHATASTTQFLGLLAQSWETAVRAAATRMQQPAPPAMDRADTPATVPEDTLTAKEPQ